MSDVPLPTFFTCLEALLAVILLWMSGPRNYVVVSTHAAYGEARAKLLDSLDAVGWPRCQTLFVLNDRADGGGKIPGYETITFASNIYEYSCFMIPTRPDGAYLLLHDTCIVGPGFVEKAEAAFRCFRDGDSVDILWCSTSGRCNLCVFGTKASQAAWALWGDMTTLDKVRAVQMEHNRDDPLSLKSLTHLNHVYAREPSRPIGSGTPYSSRHKRVELHFPYIDVTKHYADMGADMTHGHPQEP